jgi:hypothetical protein
MRLLTAAAVTVILWCSTAFAVDEYYIALSNEEARCQLLEIPPQSTAFTLLADGKVFFNKEKAQDAMASLPECELVGASTSSDPAGAKEISSAAKEASRRVKRSLQR